MDLKVVDMAEFKFGEALRAADEAHRKGQPIPPTMQAAATLTPSPKVGTDAYWRLQVMTCKHRGKADCACSSKAKCALGKGNAGEVSIADCLRCVKAGENVEVKTLALEGGSVGKLHNLEGLGKGVNPLKPSEKSREDH